MSTPASAAAGSITASGSGAGLRRAAGYGRNPLPLSQLQNYNPNRADQIEAIWQPFYHKVAYPTTGQAALQFFNIAFSGDYTITNMPAAAFFPAPTAFLCTAIMLNFLPGNPAAVDGAAAAPANVENWNDVVKIANAGYVEFVIGGKVYLRDSPSGRFAPNYTINGVAASSGTYTANNETVVNYARAAGRYYEITPFLIPQTQNFSVTLYTPTLQTITTAGNVIATMDGFYYRQSQ
jgi:hypothetical protein